MRDLVDELLQVQVRARLFGATGAAAPRLGRLELTARLGAGAMGTVFAAYDPRLERKVAVKVLHDAGTDGERVLREARALGKLAHPNVVAVHDADEVDGVVYIVMELATGATLRAWLSPAGDVATIDTQPSARPAPAMGVRRPWREVALVMRQAGAGVAAAHRAGLVHRDLKPDNVLVGDDRVQVVDFGLARDGGTDDAHDAGTPVYMAPEVLGGAAATAASDQFAFAVTLHEALYGTRPHAGTTREELRASAALAARTARARVSSPAWMRALLARALDAEPARRFPAMDDLLAALDRGLARDRRRVRVLAIGVVALVAGGVVGVVGTRAHTAADPCGGGADRVAVAWSPASAARVQAALAPWGERPARALDAVAEGWSGSYRHVCEATRVRGDQSDRLLEVRMRCLDRVLARTSALVSALEEPLDPAARASAMTAVLELPAASRCEGTDEPAERAPAPADPATAAAQRAVDRGWALYALARYADARAAIRDAPAEPADARELHASRLLLAGAIEARIGEPASARTALQAALEAAAAAHDDDAELDAWAHLLRLELFRGEPARTIDLMPYARAAAARAGRGTAELDGILGEALRTTGQLGPAREALVRARESQDVLRADQRAVIELNLGAVELAAGDAAAADALFVRAEARARALLGADHPELALYADKLAASARARGQLAAALAFNDASLATRERAFGPDDRAVATSLFHRAETLVASGEVARARADLARARAIRVHAFGEHSTRLAEIDALLATLDGTSRPTAPRTSSTPSEP